MTDAADQMRDLIRAQQESGERHRRVVRETITRGRAELETAVDSLLDLTECRCPEDWTNREMHEPNAACYYREDAEIVADFLGVMIENPVRKRS